MTNHKLYITWRNMKRRCYSPSDSQYENYGGRGIIVHPSWLGKEGFNNFVRDMGPRPEGCSIDRIDNNGNYEPSNCRWATKHEQQSNKSTSNKNVGVYIQPASKGRQQKYIGSLVVNGKVHKKSFYTEQSAISYRKQLEEKYL